MDVKNNGTFRYRLTAEMDNQVISPLHSISITVACGLTSIASLESEPFTRAFHNRNYSFNMTLTFADMANGIPYELLRRALNREEFQLTIRPQDQTTTGYAAKLIILKRCAISNVTMDNMDDDNSVMRLNCDGEALEFGFDNFRTNLRGDLI